LSVNFGPKRFHEIDSSSRFSAGCGKFPDPIDWGTCEIALCLEIPAPTGYTTTAVAPIAVNATINYTCLTLGNSLK
jgi:hypothetical protein